MKRGNSITGRRNFIKQTGIAAIGLTAPLRILGSCTHTLETKPDTHFTGMNTNENTENLIGLYGPWAVSLNAGKLPAWSFRNDEFKDVASWKKRATTRVLERLAMPDLGALPKVTIKKKSTYDGLQVEEITWQLPYGRPTEAIVLKPIHVNKRLPGILAFHDHGGNKYFGKQKITSVSSTSHELIKDHQKEYYSGVAWANEIAKRGYVVMVSDAFPFESRRVHLADVPTHLRNGLTDENHNQKENIVAYNKWAGDHEHIMAKSLFSAGTTWPGVFFAEDKIALDILCDREDVDATKIGCGGLSGGGMRTVFMGGLDERIKCAVCVGFMTTWKDFILHKSFTHTWMTYVPLLPNELDFPEIIGLRTPLPTLIQNDTEDDLYTLSEMKSADAMLGEIYTKANAAGKYQCTFYPGPHKFDASMQQEAFDWFDKWLK